MRCAGMIYTISGWSDRGEQIVGTVWATSQQEAEEKFLQDIDGGEVNEILDVYRVRLRRLT